MRPGFRDALQAADEPMISGRSGLPKLRLSVIASGLPPTAVDVAPGARAPPACRPDKDRPRIARRDVDGQRQAFGPSCTRTTAASPPGALHGIAQDDVVVLLPDPALAAHVGRADPASPARHQGPSAPALRACTTGSAAEEHADGHRQRLVASSLIGRSAMTSPPCLTARSACSAWCSHGEIGPVS